MPTGRKRGGGIYGDKIAQRHGSSLDISVYDNTVINRFMAVVSQAPGSETVLPRAPQILPPSHVAGGSHRYVG